MSTLAAGANTTGTFTANDSLSVVPQGNTYQFESPTGTVLFIGTAQRTFGPYSNQTWKLTSVSGNATMYYEATDGPGEIAVSRALTAADDQKKRKCTTTLSLTIAPGLGDFGCAIIPASGATISIVSSGGVLLNGATTTLTRAQSSNVIFAIEADPTAPDSYVVTGS